LGDAEYADMRGCVPRMTFGRQTGARPACRQLGCVFRLVEKCEIVRGRTVKRRNSCDAAVEIGARPRLRTGEGSDLSHGEPVAPPEKNGLGHALNRGPAGRIRISPRHRSGTAAPGRRVPCSAGRNNRIGADQMASPRSIPRRPRSEHAWRCRRDRAGSSREIPR